MAWTPEKLRPPAVGSAGLGRVDGVAESAQDRARVRGVAAVVLVVDDAARAGLGTVELVVKRPPDVQDARHAIAAITSHDIGSIPPVLR